MIIQGGSVPDGTAIDADVCIVGAGPAGLSLAEQFNGSRLRVYVLETGGEHRSPESDEMAQGESIGHPYFPIESSRARVLGGSSYIWEEWMRARPLDPIDFESRPWVRDSGWPMSAEDLSGFYEEAHRRLGLGDFRYEVDDPTGPLSEWPAGADVEPVLFRYSDTADFTSRNWLDASNNVCLVLEANALEVVKSVDDRKVDHVVVASAPGHRFDVRARAVVLAGGGLENPRVLMLSPSLRSAMGNSWDMIGRNFMEHPRVGIGFVDSPELLDEPQLGRGRSKRVAFAPTPRLMKETESLNGMALLTPSTRVGASDARRSLATLRAASRGEKSLESLPGHVVNVLKRPREVGRLVATRGLGRPDQQVLRLSLTVEQAPNPDSRVTLGTAADRFGQPMVQLDWRLGDHERHTMRVIQEGLDRELRQAGLGRLSGLLGDETPSRVLRGEWHQLGTTRMSLDPNSGVVDDQCRVHGVPGLYVAGGSVFPTVGYANPTLTIVALSLRLAEHLHGDLGQTGLGPIW